MPCAVELYLDPAAEARIRSLWHRIADCGLTSLLLDVGSRPHLSLAVFEQIDPERMRPALEQFARSCPPIQIDFGAIGSFPTAQGVVFVMPVVTDGLLALHRRFHQRIEGLGTAPVAYYAPGRWIPHCSVAQDIGPSEVLRAIEICQRAGALGSATCTEVALVEYRPARELYRFALSG